MQKFRPSDLERILLFTCQIETRIDAGVKLADIGREKVRHCDLLNMNMGNYLPVFQKWSPANLSEMETKQVQNVLWARVGVIVFLKVYSRASQNLLFFLIFVENILSLRYLNNLSWVQKF